MAVREIYIPEKRNYLNETMGQGMQAYQGYSMGKGIAGMFGGKAAAGAAGAAPTYGGTTGAGTTAGGYSLGAGSSYTPYAGPSSLEYTGASYAAPEVGKGVSTGGAASSGESAFSAAGPVAVGAGSMGFGAKSQFDFNAKGDKAGNAPYASKDMNPTLHWGSENLTKRMDMFNEAKDPSKWMDAKKTTELLSLGRDDKDSILNKLGQAFNLSQIFKA